MYYSHLASITGQRSETECGGEETVAALLKVYTIYLIQAEFILWLGGCGRNYLHGK